MSELHIFTKEIKIKQNNREQNSYALKTTYNKFDLSSMLFYSKYLVFKILHI